MANQWDLTRLMQGVDIWNRYREDNPEVRTDLSEADLSNINLCNANLSNTNLRRVDLKGANLSRADLRKAVLRGVELSDVVFSGANLIGADLLGATVIGPVLRGLNLSQVDLSRTDLSRADLSYANLNEADLSEAKLNKSNFNKANLRRANLRRAKLRKLNLSGVVFQEANLSGLDLSGLDLSNADLRGANLSCVTLRNATLHGANLEQANLSMANLIRADLGEASLKQATLQDANLSGLDLRGLDLRAADLSRADLSGSKLNGANLEQANLSMATLVQAQALGATFEKSIFTGACLEDWNVNSFTNFDRALCLYVYIHRNQEKRRPRQGTFQPGEFAALFQKAAETVELIFQDGIDWQAFVQSFQDLRSQYADQDFSIQAIEKKRGDAFVVRVEVSEGADKAAIENSIKQLYENQLKILEAQYEKQLCLQGEQHLEEIQRLITEERQEKATLMGVLTTMASNQGPRNDFRGAQFNSGFIETNYGKQSGGTINNYGSNTEDITRLLAALRDQAQTFPTDQKDEANDALDLLEPELKAEQPDPNRIKRQLKKLVAIATLITGLTSGAAAVSGDVSTFTGNVIELTEKLGIPMDQVQLPASGTP